VILSNQAPGAQYQFPAKEIVDAGFLELVRYGIRRADDPIIRDSLRVVDAVLKVETPSGPCWRRYNHDGYGQRADGGAYKWWGVGRAWPLLTGERGHYELAAGHDPDPYLHVLEKFSQGIGLIPEQVWDMPDLPRKHLHLGGGTGSATPLRWAHSSSVQCNRKGASACMRKRPPAKTRGTCRLNFPHLDWLTFRGAACIALENRLDQVENFAIHSGTLQLEVFRMAARDRYTFGSDSSGRRIR